jgi:hypothetical protein
MQAGSVHSYFKHNPVRLIGRGGQFMTYGTEHVVAKVRRDLSFVREATRMVAPLVAPEQAPSMGEQEAAQLHALPLKSYQKAKSVCGGLVIPFQIVESLELTRMEFQRPRFLSQWLLALRWFSGMLYSQNVVVQVRVRRNDFLPCRMKDALRQGNYALIEEMLQGVVNILNQLIMLRLFDGDPRLDSFAYYHGTLMLVDAGSVGHTRTRASAFLHDPELRSVHLRQNQEHYERLILGNARSCHREQAQRVMTEFVDQMARVYSPRNLKSKWGNVRRPTPVPDVFPLEL